MLGKPPSAPGVFNVESKPKSMDGGGGGGGGGVIGLAAGCEGGMTGAGGGFDELEECFLTDCGVLKEDLCEEEWPCPWCDGGLWLEDEWWEG